MSLDLFDKEAAVYDACVALTILSIIMFIITLGVLLSRGFSPVERIVTVLIFLAVLGGAIGFGLGGKYRVESTYTRVGWETIDRMQLAEPVQASPIEVYGTDNQLDCFLIEKSSYGVSGTSIVWFGWVDSAGRYWRSAWPLNRIDVDIDDSLASPTIQFVLSVLEDQYCSTFSDIWSGQKPSWQPTDPNLFVDTGIVGSIKIRLNSADYAASAFADPTVNILLMARP